MEDYIFLIIAVALSIIGAINQNKKKKAAENLPETETEAEEDRPQNFFMDQLLGEDFLGEPIVKKAPPVKLRKAPAHVVFKSSSNIQKIENYQMSRFKSTLPERPKHKSILTIQKQKEEEEIEATEESINYLEDFSLRKAFVYSQIMERKY